MTTNTDIHPLYLSSKPTTIATKPTKEPSAPGELTQHSQFAASNLLEFRLRSKMAALHAARETLWLILLAAVP